MRPRAGWLALTAAGCLLAGDAAARITLSLPEGARVRITAPFQGIHREVGTVSVSGEEGMVVTLEDDGTRIGLPHRMIALLEVSQGRRPATALGAAIGAALGVTIAAVSLPTPDSDRFLETGDMGGGGGGDGLAILGGGLIGAAMGAMIGSRVTVETWRPVPWMGALPRGGFGAGVTLPY